MRIKGGNSEEVEADMAARGSLIFRGGWKEKGSLLGKGRKVLGSKGRRLQLLSAPGVGAEAMNKPLPHLVLSHMPQEEKEIIVFPVKEQKYYHSGGRRAA